MAKEKPDGVRGDIIETLKNIRNGDAIYDLTSKLSQVIEAVRETGKAGVVTLKLTMKPHKGSAHMVMVSDDITAKIPEKDREVSIFYTTEQNTLQREDPRQLRLPLNFKEKEQQKELE